MPKEIARETENATALTTDESTTLADCEKIIERGKLAFFEVGTALRKIRDGRLYRGTHETFDGYVKERWDFGRAYASRLIGAAETVELLPIGNTPTPTCEAQVRPLLQFNKPEDRVAVWQDVCQRAAKSGCTVTAKLVEDHVDQHVAWDKDGPYKALRLERKRAQKERWQKRREKLQTATPKPPAPQPRSTTTDIEATSDIASEVCAMFEVTPEQLDLAADLKATLDAWHENHSQVKLTDLAEMLEFYAKFLRSEAAQLPATCRHCGAHEFDDDGDCRSCLEPCGECGRGKA